MRNTSKDIKNEHSIYGLKWYPSEEFLNGEYDVTFTGTDEKGCRCHRSRR